MATATYIPIATQTLGSAAASITFNSIPGTYTDLRLVFIGKITVSGDAWWTLNGDTATNYSSLILTGSGVAASSGARTSASHIFLDDAGNMDSTIPMFYTMDLMSYAGSTNKTVLVTENIDLNGSGFVAVSCCLWRSTAAITSITLTAGTSTFPTGTIATLFGI